MPFRSFNSEHFLKGFAYFFAAYSAGYSAGYLIKIISENADDIQRLYSRLERCENDRELKK